MKWECGSKETAALLRILYLIVRPTIPHQCTSNWNIPHQPFGRRENTSPRWLPWNWQIYTSLLFGIVELDFHILFRWNWCFLWGLGQQEVSSSSSSSSSSLGVGVGVRVRVRVGEYVLIGSTRVVHNAFHSCSYLSRILFWAFQRVVSSTRCLCIYLCLAITHCQPPPSPVSLPT